MFYIRCEETDIIRFASEEMQNYLFKLNGELPRVNSPMSVGTPIYLGRPDWLRGEGIDISFADGLCYDGYALSVSDETIAITSLEERGVIFGVYGLLRRAGCKWLFPGELGEFLPEGLEFECGTVLSNPDYEIRSYTDDTRVTPLEAFTRESIDKIDWACKNGLNTYYLSGGYHMNGYGNLEIVCDMLKRRGTMLEIGSHGTANFIDRALFDTKPELFRMNSEGKRVPDGNFCTSNPEGIEMVVDGVRRCLRANADLNLRLIHAWFSDTFGGAWCSCPKCRDKTPMEQMLTAVNAIAEMLEREFPGVKCDCLLYHDTIDIAESRIKPHRNVTGYSAPRERCYSHSIADPTCEANRRFLRQLTDAMSAFGEVGLFEYYGDMILWNKMAADLPGVLVKDLREYKAAGVNHMTILMFNAYSWLAYPLNMYVYSQAVWNTEVSADELTHEFVSLCYGASAERMLSVVEKKIEATSKYLTFCGYTELSDIRNIPAQNKEFYAAHVKGIIEALGLFRKCLDEVRALHAEEKCARVRARLAKEELILEITLLQLEATQVVMDGQYKCAFEDDKQSLIDAFTKAIELVEAIKPYAFELPLSVIGVNGRLTFHDHLCGDLLGHYTASRARTMDN